MSVHGEVVTKKLSPEELAELDRKYGKPTQPLSKSKSGHYAIMPKDEPRKTCTVEGCNKKRHRRGLCSSHYYYEYEKKGMK